MPDALKICWRLLEWIEGDVSLDEFEDWFVPATWNIHRASDPEAEDLTDEIELSLAEYSGGHLTIEELKAELAKLVHIPFARNAAQSRVGAVDPDAFPIPGSNATSYTNQAMAA